MFRAYLLSINVPERNMCVYIIHIYFRRTEVRHIYLYIIKNNLHGDDMIFVTCINAWISPVTIACVGRARVCLTCLRCHTISVCHSLQLKHFIAKDKTFKYCHVPFTMFFIIFVYFFFDYFLCILVLVADAIFLLSTGTWIDMNTLLKTRWRRKQKCQRILQSLIQLAVKIERKTDASH